MFRRAFWSVVGVCAFLPGVATAQPMVGGGAGIGHHYPHGPRVAPAWGYYGLNSGPYVGYPPPGAPGYPAFGYSHGIHPPVPTYGPLPDIHVSGNLHRY